MRACCVGTEFAKKLCGEHTLCDMRYFSGVGGGGAGCASTPPKF